MNIKILNEVSSRGHEQVSFFNYPKVGLKAIVGIHSTALGPSLGGCRIRQYESEEEAIDDVLRLSEGMTYKSALAGLALGGGKACIMADPHIEKGRREIFLQFGHCLNHLNGRYITAEDMGTSVEDINVMREVSKFAAGYEPKDGGSGDPSPWTALGVFHSIQAVCGKLYGSSDLKGKHVALQGVGHVGMYLLQYLVERGARVSVCDTDDAALKRAQEEYGAKVVGLEEIYSINCDVFAPCAVGQTVNPQTVRRLKCDIIAGAANNILSDDSVYKMLEEKKILYCPDFVINAGGVISVGAEYVDGGWQESWVAQKTKNISNTILRVLDESEKRKKFPEVVAIELAKEIVQAAEEEKASVA